VKIGIQRDTIRVMDIEQTANKNVLSYLLREDSFMYQKRLDAPIFTPWNSVTDPYRKCGCHPEAVQRLWDEIGPALPDDCRALIYLAPALVHPRSGIILGLGMGTEYVLRLAGGIIDSAISKGVKRSMKDSTGTTTNLEEIFGDDWVFGAWLKEELTWCQQTYEVHTSRV
jgi:hypothetical protein